MAKKYRAYRIYGLIGILGVIFYFVHVFSGQVLYPGYQVAAQPVSALTAAGAPSRVVATIFSVLYGICAVVFSFGLFISLRDRLNRKFEIGALLLFCMEVISLIGYFLFPLQQVGLVVGWKNIAHWIVTAAVVLLTIAALIFIGMGTYRRYIGISILSYFTLFLVMSGAVLTRVVPASYFGYAERISVFSIVIYMGLLAFWMMFFKPKSLNWY